MRAIVIDEFGGPDVLHLKDVLPPEAGPGQARVRVRAAGINPYDTKLRAGFLQEYVPVTLPTIPGLEVAGTVDQVGPDVDWARVGDEVFGFADTGGYAEYALVTKVVPKPAELDWTTAAGLPIAAEAATGVLDELALTDGETILINGAAGAVGTIATQLAIARGATVIGTASDGNHYHLRDLGATPVNYGPGLADRVRAEAPNGVDAVFDMGQGGLPDAMDLRGGTSRIITISDMSAYQLGIRLFGAADRDPSAIAGVARLVADGSLILPVRTFPLADAAATHKLVETGHNRGKRVFTVQ
jgi:NADPH:quinone reductase-like Zn-dependent oxidoreductase